MFAFLACLAQAKATGAENGLDIKFIIRLPACLPSYVSVTLRAADILKNAQVA